jgi:hypothetical protein
LSIFRDEGYLQRQDFIKLTLGGIALAAFSPLLKTSKAFVQATLEKLSQTNNEWNSCSRPRAWITKKKPD